MNATQNEPRFHPGQRILASRSGHCGDADSIAEVLQVIASATTEIYRVRWEQGLETFFLPGPEARDRRCSDDGPPAGTRERRFH